MAKDFPIDEIEMRLKAVMFKAPKILGNDAVNFFKDSFKRQGWLGDTFVAWKPRKEVTRWGNKNSNKGRAILVQNATLKKSIRITNTSATSVTIGTDVKYARAHNEGLRLGLIQQVKEYTRKKTTLGIVGKKQLKTKTNLKFGRVATGEESTVKAHKRRINQKIPQRQFMGSSPYLTSKLKARLNLEIQKVFRQY